MFLRLRCDRFSMSDVYISRTLICATGRSVVSPSDRCSTSTISYCRLLLDDTTFKVHQFRAGFIQSKLCDCTQGVDDLQHFFFQCKNYEAFCHDLIDRVQSVLSLVDHHKRPNLSTSLLLMPSCYEQISNRVSAETVGCTFEYIRKSKQHL